MIGDYMAKLKITFSGYELEAQFQGSHRINYLERTWSAANLYRQLHLLENLVPRRRMVVNMKPGVSSTTSFSTPCGIIVDHTNVVADRRLAGFYLADPQFVRFKDQLLCGFFVIENKHYYPPDHISHAVCELFERGTLLQKQIIRGALTDGRTWIFLLVKLNDNYDGAGYLQSQPVQYGTAPSFNDGVVVPSPWPGLIAAILSYWIEHSFEELG